VRYFTGRKLALKYAVELAEGQNPNEVKRLQKLDTEIERFFNVGTTAV